MLDAISLLSCQTPLLLLLSEFGFEKMMMPGRNSGRCPFTASQWQELETQALIFKYMASGHPIPPDLILPIRKNILMDTTPPTLFPHQPNSIGWGYFQMGFGRKAEDPEPGRCRRTDGKKWRCAKEAYPDSKYCERHMHRGKNRSRKPVEMSLNTTPTITKSHNCNSSSSSYLNMAASETHSSMYPYDSYSKPPVIGLSPQSNTTRYHLDSISSSGERDYRYLNQSQYSCFSDGSEAERNDSWRFTPLGMSLGEPKQNSCSQFGGEQQEKQQHCFVLGSDFKLGRNERDFFQECPLKNKETWMGLEEDNSFTRTQLSISMAQHDLANSQSRTDD